MSWIRISTDNEVVNLFKRDWQMEWEETLQMTITVQALFLISIKRDIVLSSSRVLIPNLEMALQGFRTNQSQVESRKSLRRQSMRTILHRWFVDIFKDSSTTLLWLSKQSRICQSNSEMRCQVSARSSSWLKIWLTKYSLLQDQMRRN